MTEEEVLASISSSLPSIWALEVLLLVRSQPAKHWSSGELVRELRGSASAIAVALSALEAAQLILRNRGRVHYNAANADVEAAVTAIAELYATKPAAVIRAIVSGADRNLKMFSDAFRFRDETK
ncbi:MAG: hypothetical protein ACTHPD_02645 [Rhizomicrobium sp.]